MQKIDYYHQKFQVVYDLWLTHPCFEYSALYYIHEFPQLYSIHEWLSEVERVLKLKGVFQDDDTETTIKIKIHIESFSHKPLHSTTIRYIIQSLKELFERATSNVVTPINPDLL